MMISREDGKLENGPFLPKKVDNERSHSLSMLSPYKTAETIITIFA